ncbi:hypothetical protein ACGFS9_14430 [Streptomyces sp. NPDC048566]|uniref:hypothetical protein n=1 Tax=Streptomyces sp. NPDC048566 TaxID=3365569 RepID=UPI003711E048
MRTYGPARRGAGFVLATALLAGCSAGHDAAAGPDRSAGAAAPSRTSPTPSSPAPSSPTPSSPAPSASYPTRGAAPGAATPLVRDSFAVLQATYNDGCGTPGNCAYFLNRLVTDLDDLYDSMNADPKGPAHFADPVAWIAAMQDTLDGDFSYANLKRHRTLLTGTRDKVNAWMQSHPDDYR